MNWFRLKGCTKCRGDLVLDDLDWLCLQCGTYYYTGLYRNKNDLKGPSPNGSLPTLTPPEKAARINLKYTGIAWLNAPTLPLVTSLTRQTGVRQAATANISGTSTPVHGTGA